jgi:hypothetical protein
MNSNRLNILKNDLIRLQANGNTLEECLRGFDTEQSRKYANNIKNEIFQIEETYCNAMAEIREIKSFLYGA